MTDQAVEHLCCGGELPCQWGTCDIPAGFHAEPHKKNDGCANWRTSYPAPDDEPRTEGEAVYIELSAALMACMMAGHVLDGVAEKFTAVGNRIDAASARLKEAEALLRRWVSHGDPGAPLLLREDTEAFL